MSYYLKRKNLRIGISGGTFDPAHKGHLKISIIAKKKIKLDYIIWAITQKNPLKKIPTINIKERIKISKRITKKFKFIKIDFFESKIKSKHTIDLVKFLKSTNTSLDIFFIMGADNLINFHKWKNWKKIPELAKIVVFNRANYSYKALNSIAAKKLKKKDWMYINTKKVNISSSLIKKFW